MRIPTLVLFGLCLAVMVAEIRTEPIPAPVTETTEAEEEAPIVETQIDLTHADAEDDNDDDEEDTEEHEEDTEEHEGDTEEHEEDTEEHEEDTEEHEEDDTEDHHNLAELDDLEAEVNDSAEEDHGSVHVPVTLPSFLHGKDKRESRKLVDLFTVMVAGAVSRGMEDLGKKTLLRMSIDNELEALTKGH